MVIDDPPLAGVLVAGGSNVVLVTAGDPVEPVVTDSAGPGRLAVLVGDPTDQRVMEVAAEMDRELFGPVATFPPGPSPD